jgi:hypothetical protein
MISSSLKSCGVPGDMGSPKTVTVETYYMMKPSIKRPAQTATRAIG